MSTFTLYDENTASAESKPLLAKSQAAFGMIPNLHAVMAESPELLNAYQTVHGLFSNCSMNAEQLTVVWQTINVENGCLYCVPAHTAIAKGMGIDDAITEALRNGTPLPTAELEALRDFTLKIINDKGIVNEASIQTFLDAGYTRRNVLEVVLGYSQKIMSNYTNHLAHTPVDAPFQPFAWEK